MFVAGCPRVSADALKTPKTLADAQVDLKSWTFSVIPGAGIRAKRIWTPGGWSAIISTIQACTMWSGPPCATNIANWSSRVRDRDELSDLISDMVSELSALHTFVGGGDLRKAPDQIPVGIARRLTGARRDAQVAIASTIFIRPIPIAPTSFLRCCSPAPDSRTAMSSPPSMARACFRSAHPDELLRNQIGKQVLVAFHHKGQRRIARRHREARLYGQDADLRYSEWEYTRRKRVERKPATGRLVTSICVPWDPTTSINGKKNTRRSSTARRSSSTCATTAAATSIAGFSASLCERPGCTGSRARGLPYWNMQGAFRGPMIVLCDEITGSDGEAFAEGFRRLGLGKVIGTRTWGGEIWLSASNGLADQGIATAAEMGVYGPERQWLIEGHGVDPDIVVDNLPHATFEGQDAQLEAAIRALTEQIAQHPQPVPAPPAYPNKSFRAPTGSN